MKLQEAYEFSEWTQREGLLVAAAREKLTGRQVQIHLFPSTRTADAQTMFQRVLELPDEARRRILACGQGDGGGYFVTEPLAKDLRSWFDDSLPPPSVPAPEVSSGTRGHLSEMPIQPPALTPLAPFAEPPRKAETLVTAPPVSAVPPAGEHTMFLAQLMSPSAPGQTAPARTQVAAQTSAPPPVSRPAAVSGPVAEQRATAPQTQPAPVAAAKEPGEATQFLLQMLQKTDGGASGASPVTPVRVAAVPPPEPPASRTTDANGDGADDLMRRLYERAPAPGWREQESAHHEPVPVVPAAPAPQAKDGPGLGTWLGVWQQTPPTVAGAVESRSAAPPLPAAAPSTPVAAPAAPVYHLPPVPPAPATGGDSLWGEGLSSSMPAPPPSPPVSAPLPPPPLPAPPARPAKAQGGSGLKTILMVVAAVVVLILAVVAVIEFTS